MIERIVIWTTAGARPLCLALAVYTVLAAAFAVIVPPFESPDETGHLFYIDYVAVKGRLPNQDDPAQRVEGEGHQFPLYYALAALPVRAALADHSVDLTPIPNRTPGQTPPGVRPKFVHRGPSIFDARSDKVAFYALRALSILLGAGTVALSWLVAGELLTTRDQRLLATLLVATLPQFLFISASVNNDNLANLLTTLAILFLMRLQRDPTTTNAVGLGVALGLALCTKKTSLFLLPGGAVIMTLVLVSAQLDRQRMAWRLSAVPAIVLACSGWVFVRNQRLYGDPLGSAMERRTLPLLVDEKSLLDRYWVDPFLPRLGESFAGVFGWMDVRLPSQFYFGYLILGIAAAAGVGLRLREPAERAAHLLVLALVASCFAGVIVYNLTYTQYQGRFLFPVISLVAALCVLGWSHLLRDAGHRWRVQVGAALVLVTIAVNLYALLMLCDFYGDAAHYIAAARR